MSKQSGLLAALFVIFVTAGFAAATFWRTRHGDTHGVPALATGTAISPQRTFGEFKLIDQHGRSFTPVNLRGQWSVLYFGYTHCPDICPLTLSTLARVDRNMRAQSRPVPRIIFVSVDPHRDTAATLAQYVPYFDEHFLGVTAAEQSGIDAFARQLGVAVIITPARDGTYTVDHSGALFVIAPSGKLAAVLTGPMNVAELTGDFQKLLASAAG